MVLLDGRSLGKKNKKSRAWQTAGFHMPTDISANA